MTHPTAIFLSSGEFLLREEILEGFLLLARHEAEFPIVTQSDARLAVMMLTLETLEHNDEHDVI